MEPDAFGVEVSCINCTFVRVFRNRDEIPEEYKAGCPRCKDVMSVTQVGR